MDHLRSIMEAVRMGGGGYFRTGSKTGALTAATANTPIVSFRWTSTVYNAIILAARWHWFTTTAFGAAQIVDHGLYVARAFTGVDSGGNALTLTTNNGKKSTGYTTTRLGDFRMSSTAFLTAGTRTLDAQAQVIRGAWSGGIGQGLTPFDSNFLVKEEGPIILAAEEGLILNNLTAMGATGVISLAFEVAWAELLVDTGI